MPHFFGIEPGQEKTAPGLRVRVSDDGERVWMHGKWLELGPDHAVIWAEHGATFRNASGKTLMMGQFPAWVVGSRKRGGGGPWAAMFNVGQFLGGEIRLT